MVHTLDALAATIRSAPGWQAKAHIAVVRERFGPSDWLRGPGDDGAIVSVGDEEVVACGEAILPAFVEHDPYGAGVAAVLTNVNDVAAMGAVPLAIVDTIVGPTETCRAVLDGLRFASELYDVPIVGGHLTNSDDRVALSAFAVGRCPGPVLSATRVAPGQQLALVACLEGRMRVRLPVLPVVRRARARARRGRSSARRSRRADGVVVAAKDVSMAGLFGSLAMLLEATRCGASIAVESVPVPDGVAFDAWAMCFPCFAFLVTMPLETEDRCRRAVEGRGLTYAPLGRIDGSGVLALTDGGDTATLIDLNADAVTGLRESDAPSARAARRRRSPASPHT